MKVLGNIKSWLAQLSCSHEWIADEGPAVSKQIVNGLPEYIICDTRRCKKCGKVSTTIAHLPHGL